MIHAMKNKNIWLLTILSFLVCVLHAVMLNTQYTFYVYTSILKIALFILCPIIYFKIVKDGKSKDILPILPIKGDKKNIRFSFVLGLCVFASIFVLYFILHSFLDSEMIVGALAKNGITADNFVFVFIYIVFINAALEEIFFRGFVFMTLYRMNLKRYAHIYSSFLFAFYHVAVLNNALVPGIFIFCIAGLAVAGLIFNIMAAKCKSITGSLIVHISANLALNLIVVFHY